MKLEQRMQSIRLILSDVDGVLTDGGISYDNQGIETKKFHVRDGLGIKLWQRAGHQFGIITARSSHIVKLRASELGVELVRQGSSDKWTVAQQVLAEVGLEPESLCYIGDDLTDLPLLTRAGMAVAVADGVEEVRNVAHLVTSKKGGEGAIRELIETVLRSQKRWTELVQNYIESAQ